MLKELGKQANVRGFRRGKVPEAILRQKYKNEIYGEMRSALIRKAYQNIQERDDIELYDVVDVGELGDVDGGSEVTLDITVDVVPSFELPDYSAIATQVPPSDVDDSEVDAFIDNLRRQRANFEKVERAAQAGDYVKVSYMGTLDGEPIQAQLEAHANLRAWGTVTDGWEEAGTDEAKQFGVPAVIDAVVGLEAGGTATVEQVIADTFAVEALRGKTVQYAIEVSEVRERVLPELDEEFLKSTGAESIEDFKAQVLDHLEGNKRQQAERAKRQQILDYIAGAVDIPLPQSGLEAETQQTMGRIMVQNMQQGVPEEEFEKNKEALHASATQTAQRELKLQLILNRIAREEKIEISNEDLSRAVYAIAQQQRRKPEELVKELRKDQRQLHSLQRQVLFSKTLDKLMETATETVVAAPVADEKAES